MNKIKDNKKLFVVIVIISLLAILLGSYAIYKNSNKDETTSKIEKSEKLEKKAENKLKEAKKSGDKEDIAKAEKELKEAEEKTEDVKDKKSASSTNANTSKSTSTASKSSTNSSSGATSTKPAPKPKEKKKVWIIDKPAWTETVQEPIYSERNVWYASNWDNSKSAKFYSLEECNNWLTTVGEGMGGYQKTTEQYISGYNTKTINHPEEGHWEYR